MSEISGHVAIVTGASSGIGRAVCSMLAEHGCNLALVARREPELCATAELCESETLILPTDLCDVEATRAVAPAVAEAFGRIDAVVNVAGFATTQTIADVTPDVWQKTIDVNLTAVVNLTAAAWPHLARQGGIVVNVSSMASIDPFEGLNIYATAKAGVNMFTRCIAQEGGDVNISSVAIAPGAVETPMLRGLFDEKMLPADATLAPEKVAELIVACVTGGRAFDPGETIILPSP